MSRRNLLKSLNLPCAILVLAVFLLLPGVGAQVASQTVASQLIDHYGQGPAQFILINFNFFLGNPSGLEAYLLRLQQEGRLVRLCMYIPVSSKCLYPRFGVYTQTQLIIDYLRGVCCSSGQVITQPPTTTMPPLTPSPTLPPTAPASTGTCGRVLSLPVTARITNGNRAAAGQFPWACQLLENSLYQCGCIIIDRLHVLTAGHCLNGWVENNVLTSRAFEIIAGKLYTNLDMVDAGQQRIRVVGGKRHESFNNDLLHKIEILMRAMLVNDIAVLLLETPLTFSNVVSPVCLPPSVADLPSPCTLAGFGTISFFGPVADQLMFEDIYTYTADVCLKTFQPTTSYNISIYLTPNVICAANGTFGGKDACRGDSGSPLMCILNTPNPTYYLFGIVSSGFNCAVPGQPGFYTYVVKFVDWIYAAVSQLR